MSDDSRHMQDADDSTMFGERLAVAPTEQTIERGQRLPTEERGQKLAVQVGGGKTWNGQKPNESLIPVRPSPPDPPSPPAKK